MGLNKAFGHVTAEMCACKSIVLDSGTASEVVTRTANRRFEARQEIQTIGTAPFAFGRPSMKWIVTFILLNMSMVTRAQSLEYVHTDPLGSPVAISNQAGQVIERRQYEPYGGDTEQNKSDRPSYTGHVMDSQSGLSYMQQRYYDSNVGRFLSTDPVQSDANTGYLFNRYWYGNNNPYKFTDPDGRESPCITLNTGCGLAQGNFERNVGFFLFGVDTTYTPPPGSGAVQSVVTPFEFGMARAATGLATRAFGGAGAKLFQNLAPKDPIIPAQKISPAQIQSANYSGRLNYVVKKDGSLVIGRTNHPSLAQGGAVRSAGEARFVHGKLRTLNNASGHYQPSGASAQKATESAFERAGFETVKKYREINP